MAEIPSLGDSPTVSMKKVQETYPLPKSRKEIVTAFERILNLGGVQRVVIEYGSAVKVTRLVKPETESEDVPEELQDDDIVSAARNAPMEEFIFSESILPTNYLLRAFHLLSQRKLRARTLVVNNTNTLRVWLGLEKGFDLSEIFGVQTVANKEIPEGVLLMVASPADDVDLVSFSLRLEMSEKP